MSDALKFDLNQHQAIYLQLYQRYKEAIATGVLASGDRVPSIRSLASELDVSHGTIELAYQMLISEGYLETRGPAGTFVSTHLSAFQISQQAADLLAKTSPSQLSEHASAAVSPLAPVTFTPRPFQLGIPALDAFPRKTWMRLSKQSQSRMDMGTMLSPDPMGYAALRHEIAKYLSISRGIQCTKLAPLPFSTL